MKKKCILISSIFIILVALLQTGVCATTHKLDEIEEKFNNSKVVKKYKDYGFEMKATTDKTKPNNLTITVTTDEGSSTAIYELKENILSNAQLVDSNVITAYFLADIIGQLNGYKDGELLENFNLFTDEIKNYTLEKQGLEIKENGTSYSTKMDITKKVPKIDSSKFYLKPSEFDMIEEFVKEKSNGNQSGKKGTLAYNLELDESENKIYIGERNKTTESTYKSILSALEVMYEKKVVEYFKSIYPEIIEGVMELDGFSIETDYENELEEDSMFSGMKVVLVKIDNEFVNNEILRTEYIGETVKHGDKKITFDFTKNKFFKVGIMDSIKSSDVAFLIKYVLEPIVEESNIKIEGDVAYFNIDNGQIVAGDENNNIFKIVVSDENIEMIPTKTVSETTTIIAKHKNAKSIEYEEGKTQEHFRYGEYNVTVEFIYGSEKEKTNVEIEKNKNEESTKANNSEKENKTKTNTKTEKSSVKNPKTGDNIIVYIVFFGTSLLVVVITRNKAKKQ